MPFEPRFGPAASAYGAFRPEYPPALFERILEEVLVGPRERAVDLGAGTGLSALPLCRWFREVIAVEPDAQMAAQLAGRQTNLVVENSTAEECRVERDSADLVTSGTAFHWMDGPRVLENVAAWLRPGGTLAVYGYPFPRMAEPFRGMVRREFELHWERFRHERLREKDYTRRTIAAAARLGNVQVVAIPHVVEFSAAQLIGFFSSTSYGSAYLQTLEDPGAYLGGLENAFREASGDAMIPADFTLELILARKT
jgi:trans-aconitate methyltransferase